MTQQNTSQSEYQQKNLNRMDLTGKVINVFDANVNGMSVVRMHIEMTRHYKNNMGENVGDVTYGIADFYIDPATGLDSLGATRARSMERKTVMVQSEGWIETENGGATGFLLVKRPRIIEVAVDERHGAFLIVNGRLTRDPSLSYTKNNQAVANYTVAVNYPRRADGALFAEVARFDAGAIREADRLSKGSKVTVAGYPSIRQYQSNDGQNRVALSLPIDVEYRYASRNT